MIISAAEKDSRRRPGLKLTTVAFCSLALAACSGSSGGSRTTNPNDDSSGPGTTVPTLTLSASPTSVAAGGRSTLSWSAGNAESCQASGGWSGGRSTAGSQSVGPINEDTIYRLSCSGPGGGVSRQVTVRIGNNSGPDVTLRAEPERITPNGTTTLTWSTQDVTSCSASGGWNGPQPLSGSFSVGPLSESTSYTLSCSGADGSALASVTVEVLDKVLRWKAPTQNVDGSPLTDLAGYTVYWGDQSRVYSGSHTINNASTTQWTATMGAGEYFFALTAFDKEGNESGYSNEVRKTIP